MVGQAPVTDEQVTQFQEDGAILLRGVLSSDWVDRVRKGIETNLGSPSKYSERLAEKEGQGSYFNDYCNWQRIEEFRQFAFESPAAEIAAKMMRSPYAVFYHEHVLDKEPGAEKETPWHQDQPYYPVDGHNLVSLWMPVDPVSLDSAVKFVRGSHRWGRWFHPRKFATAKNYQVESEVGGRKYEDVPVEEIEEGNHELLSWACQPGDVVVFHGLTLHGAKGNSSAETSRRVLSTRWCGEGSTLAARPWQVSPPITGGLQTGNRIHCDTFPLAWGTLS